MQHNKQRTKSHTGRTESGLNEVKYSIRTVYCTIMKWAKNLPIKIRDTCFEVESKIFNAATKTAGEGSGVKKKSRMSSASYYQYCGVSCVFIERLRLHPSAKEKIAAPPAPDPGAASYRHRFNLYSKSPPPLHVICGYGVWRAGKCASGSGEASLFSSLYCTGVVSFNYPLDPDPEAEQMRNQILQLSRAQLGKLLLFYCWYFFSSNNKMSKCGGSLRLT
jgi:hypothetical protein